MPVRTYWPALRCSACLLVALPDSARRPFDLSTRAAGPFLSSDRQGIFVRSIYMSPLKTVNAQRGFRDPKVTASASIPGHRVQRKPSGRRRAHYHMIVGVGQPGTEAWRHVPDPARSTFPSMARVLAERHVHPAGLRG